MLLIAVALVAILVTLVAMLVVLVAIPEISWSPVRVVPLEVTVPANATDKSAPVTV